MNSLCRHCDPLNSLCRHSPARYNWDIVESGVKYHNPNPDMNNEINFDNENQIKSLANIQMGFHCTNLLHSVSTMINKYMY